MRTVAKQQFTQQGCLDKNLPTDNFSLTFAIKVHPLPTTSGSEQRGRQSQCLGRVTLGAQTHVPCSAANSLQQEGTVSSVP